MLQQQIEFIIDIRLFKIIKFWYKGQYCLRISLTQQNKDKQIKQSAYPHIINYEMSNSRKTDSKPQKIKNKQITQVQNNHGYYQSKIFEVFFQNQQVDMDNQCIFKMQYPYGDLRHDTYLNIQIVKNKKVEEQAKKISNNKLLLKAKSATSLHHQQSQSSNLNNLLFNNHNSIQVMKIVKKVKTKVTSKKILLNPKRINHLDQFCLPLFSDNQYFSMVYLYVGAVHLGWKLRKNMQRLCEFICLKQDTRQDMIRSRSFLNNYRDVCDNLNSCIKIPSERIIDFYEETVVLSKKSYNSILKRTKKLSNLFENDGIYSQMGHYTKLVIDQQEISQKILHQKYQKYQNNQLIFEILKESSLLAIHTRKLWELFCITLKKLPLKSILRLCEENQNKLKQQYWALSIYKNYIKEERNQLKKKFSKNYEQLRKILSMLQQKDRNPPMFIYQGQNIMNQDSVRNSSSKMGLIKLKNSLTVFVHGFQGTFYDLQKASNYLALHNSDTQIFVIKDMITVQGDLDQIGKFVADELKRQFTLSLKRYQKINFIGYSIGGLIIRSAINHLQQLKSKMNIFMTFSTPHLGTSLCENNLVKIGVWYMSKIQKLRPIQQLNHQKLYLQNLCKSESLSWFKKVVLISSQQDEFIHHASAAVLLQRIESQRVRNNALNFINNTQCIQRLQIWFNAENRSKVFDKLIGRKSHIQFIDNDRFLDALFHLYGKQM